MKAAEKIIRPVEEGFLSMASPISAVCEFVKSICRRTFTVENVWGSLHNSNSFLSHVDRYLRLSRNESLTLNCVVQGIRLSDIPWLAESCTSGAYVRGGDDPVAAAGKRTENKQLRKFREQVFYRFMIWLFNDFVNALVSVCFYATEAEGKGNETLFFRKPIWSELMKKGLKQMENNFMPVRIFCYYFIASITSKTT
jgi:hypothetical protein